MAQVQIKKMSTRHEEILQHILRNPTKTYGDVAAFFGVTPAWLAVIVNSDVFQDKLKERQDEMFDTSVLQGISVKMAAAADLTIEKYMEKLPQFTPDQVISGADKLLGKLGFGSNAGTVVNGDVYQQVNHNHVDKAVVAQAREMIGRATEVGAPDFKAALLYQTTEERIETEGVAL